MKIKSLSRGPLTIQIGLNSLVGYLFLKVLALKFGTSAQKDGFDIAYSVPFIVMSVSGFTFLHSIITTQFSKMLANESRHIDSVFSTVLTCMLCLGGGFVLLCMLLSRPLTGLLAPGLSPQMQQETQRLIVAMCPLVFTLGISTYLSAVLIAYAVPVTMEFCQLITRLGVIVGVLILRQHYTLMQVAVGLVAFSALVMAYQWNLMRRTTGIRYRPTLHWSQPEFIGIAQQGMGFLVAAVFSQVSMSYMRRLATLDGPGTTAALTYAFSLSAPLSMLLGKPLALSAGPEYIRSYEVGDMVTARAIFLRCLAFCLVASAIAVTAISLFATPLIHVLYGGGRFDLASVMKTTGLFRVLIWSLPPSIILWVTLMPLLSADRSHTAAGTYVAGYCTQLVMSYLLFPVSSRFGPAWAYVLAISLQAAIGIAYVVRGLARNLERARCSA
ncbi:MAG TPA: lipid II flippase MurJ [Chthonomonadaceae bacterium]|nr:lipid II flippase MurJ [Chthonomonadaceae bacterium]